MIQPPPAADQEATVGEGEEPIDPEVEKRKIASKIFKPDCLVGLKLAADTHVHVEIVDSEESAFKKLKSLYCEVRN